MADSTDVLAPIGAVHRTPVGREATEPMRVGFAVSRQLKNAVQRNRARRRLREAYRASRDAAPAQGTMVIVGRPAALTEPFAVLTGQLRAALAAIPASRPDA